MRRGTRVGQAYVAVTADGSGINNDIVDAVDEAGSGVGEAGNRHGEEYGEQFSGGFRDRMRSRLPRIGAALSERLGRNLGHQIESGIGDIDISRNLTESLDDDFGERLGARLGDAVGEAVSDRLEVQMAEMLDMVDDRFSQTSVSRNGHQSSTGAGPGAYPLPSRDDRVLAQAERMNEAFDRQRVAMIAAAERMDEAYDRRRTTMLDLAHRMNEAHDRREGVMVDRALAMNEAFDRSRGAMLDRAYRMNADFDRRREEMAERTERATVRMLEAADRMNEKFDRDRSNMIDRAYRMNEDFDRSRGRMIDRAYEMNEAFDRARHRMIERAYADNDRYDRARTRLLAQAHRMNALYNSGRLTGDGQTVRSGGPGGSTSLFDSDRIGKMFGAGSRNNFLNLFGKSIGGSISLVSKFGDVGEKVFTSIAEKMAQAGMQGGRFGGALARMAPLLGTVAGSGAGLVVLAAIMGLVASAAGALLGILTALASTIASALVGAAAVGGAALAALAAAAGLATVAFTSMTDAQKEMLSSAFQPLKAELTGIGQLMLGQMVPAFSTWSNNLQQALLPLAGHAQRFGAAFAQAGNIITASFGGPGFQAFIQALGTYLPSIITRLSTGLGGFLNGLMGTFAAIMPQVNRFAGYLARVGQKFSDWANSAKGQNAIVDFVDRAVNSLISLWGAVRSVMGFIKDLLFNPQSQAAGNSIFDGIARTFEGFRQKVAEAAANGDLQRWLESAIEFGAAFWGVMKGLGKVFMALYNSGLVDAMSAGMKGFGVVLEGLSIILGPVIDLIGWALPGAIATAVTPIMTIASAIIAAGEAIEWLGEKVGLGNGAEDPLRGFNDIKEMWDRVAKGNMPFASPNSSPAETAKFTLPDIKPSNFSLRDLLASGDRALNATREDYGGYMPNPPEYVNPYTKWAESLMSEGPTIARQVRQSMRQIDKEVARALRDAARAANAGEAKSALNSVIDSMKSNIQSVVDSARSGLDSAASSLASASSAEDAAKALREVKRAQSALTRALTAQNKVNAQAKILARQKVVDWGNVRQLQWGTKVQGATLADFAAARERMAAKIERANEKLDAAIALRNDYKNAVVESVRAFGSILTAEAKTVDGVQQALTATDITTNLQDRLTKIRAYQNNLRTLLGMGLSEDAYKQLVDAGVEEGSAYAEALVAGGAGAVRQVNGLTSQINSAATGLGGAAANRLYQSGVDAARGLVDGLESMSSRLDSAAARLGKSIARQVEKSLGIKSPSRVMMEDMGHVGDGIVKGLEAQQRKVGMAASRLSGQVAISPEVAAYATQRRMTGAVSGNGGSGDPRFRDLIVHTPTENPEAVAHEVLNEVTARL